MKLLKTILYAALMMALLGWWVEVMVYACQSAGGWNDLNWLGKETIHSQANLSMQWLNGTTTWWWVPWQLTVWAIIIWAEVKLYRLWQPQFDRISNRLDRIVSREGREGSEVENESVSTSPPSRASRDTEPSRLTTLILLPFALVGLLVVSALCAISEPSRSSRDPQ